MAKKTAAAATTTASAPPLLTGPAAAKAFFDLAEDPVTGGGLRNSIGANNENIIALAKSFRYEFDYDEMQAELKTRWDVRKPTIHTYCCT